MRIFVPSAASLLTDHRPHGEGLIAFHLLSGLAARGHEIVACAREVDLRRSPAFEAVAIGRRSRLESLEPLAQSRAVARVLERYGGPRAFDVAHWIFPPDFDEIAAPASDELPFVYGPHALSWPASRRRFLPGDAIRLLVRPVLSRRSRKALASARLLLFAVPDAARSPFPVAAGPRAHVLPFGVSAERFRSVPMPERPTIAFVGSLEPIKRLDIVLDALARMERRDALLLVAGTGSQEQAYRDLARSLGVDGRVTWLGAVPHEDMPGLLAGVSVVCSAAIGEPYGMSLLEGMAAGRAIVAVDAGGPRFLVDEAGGRLVWPADADQVARALEGVLADPAALAGMGAWNRARVERELSWDRVVDRLEELYAEALPAA